MKKHHLGFTLMELMIAVAIVAILATLAYPSYLQQIRKSRRADSITTLGQTAQTLERCYSQYYAYNNNACPLVTGGAVAAFTSPEGYYTISSVALNADTYTLSAVPTAQGNQNSDTDCVLFTLSQSGVRTAENNASNDSAAICW